VTEGGDVRAVGLLQSRKIKVTKTRASRESAESGRVIEFADAEWWPANFLF